MAISVFPRKLKTDLAIGLIIGVAALLLVRERRAEPVARERQEEARSPVGSLERLDLRLFGWLRAREAPPPAPIGTAVVRLDEDSLARAEPELGRWPWPCSVERGLVDELHALGAKVVLLERACEERQREREGEEAEEPAVPFSGATVVGVERANRFEEASPPPGRWAVLAGRFQERRSALEAAARFIAERGAWPYLVSRGRGRGEAGPAESGHAELEVWLGGMSSRQEALSEASAISLGAKQFEVRELAAEERLERVTRALLFREFAALDYTVAPGPRPEAMLPSSASSAIRLPQASLFAARATFGISERIGGADGRLGRMALLAKYEGRLYPSALLAALMAASGDTHVKLEEGRLVTASFSAPLDRGGLFLPSRERRSALLGDLSNETLRPLIPVGALLRSGQRRQAGRVGDPALAELVAGRIVVVEAEPAGSGESDADLLASSLESLERGEGVLGVSIERESALAFLAAMVGALLSAVATWTASPRRTLLLQLLLAAASALALCYLAKLLFVRGYWLPVAIPYAAFLLSLIVATAIGFADEWRINNRLREALGRSASASLIQRILYRPREMALDGERRELTIYSVGLAGFSRISRGLEPRSLVELVRGYNTVLGKLIAEHRGLLDRCSGDTSLALWGAPLANADHALDACRAALEVRDALAKRRAGWSERYGIEPLGSCAALESGLVVVGDMGAMGGVGRASYTAVGDAVGFTSRLERVARIFGAAIVLGEGTFGHVRREMVVRELERLRRRGEERYSRVFELIGARQSVDGETLAQVARFEVARSAYLARDFADGLERFEALAREKPDDRAVAVYVERCRAALSKPPPDGWDGVSDAV